VGNLPIIQSFGVSAIKSYQPIKTGEEVMKNLKIIILLLAIVAFLGLATQAKAQGSSKANSIGNVEESAGEEEDNSYQVKVVGSNLELHPDLFKIEDDDGTTYTANLYSFVNADNEVQTIKLSDCDKDGEYYIIEDAANFPGSLAYAADPDADNPQVVSGADIEDNEVVPDEDDVPDEDTTITGKVSEPPPMAISDGSPRRDSYYYYTEAPIIEVVYLADGYVTLKWKGQGPKGWVTQVLIVDPNGKPKWVKVEPGSNSLTIHHADISEFNLLHTEGDSTIRLNIENSMNQTRDALELIGCDAYYDKTTVIKGQLLNDYMIKIHDQVLANKSQETPKETKRPAAKKHITQYNGRKNNPVQPSNSSGVQEQEDIPGSQIQSVTVDKKTRQPLKINLRNMPEYRPPYNPKPNNAPNNGNSVITKPDNKLPSYNRTKSTWWK